MSVTTHCTAPRAGDKAEMVAVRRDDLDEIMGTLSSLMDLAPRRFTDPVPDLDRAVGRAHGLMTAVLVTARPMPSGEPPLSLYEPPPPDDDGHPDPEDMAWAAENVTAVEVPGSPAGLLRYLADALEALGLEPDIADGRDPRSIGMMFQGREWGVILEDRTAYWEHIERLAAEYDRDCGHPVGVVPYGFED